MARYDSRPSPHRNKKELAAALGRNSAADVDALNNTNFHTAHFLDCGVPGFNRFRALRCIPAARRSGTARSRGITSP